MARIRHWKQRWDPTAEFVFAKRLRMGGGSGGAFVVPGDPVTPEMRERMGVARLRRWWEAGVIQLAEFDPTVRGGKPKAGIESNGRGWYTVTFADGETKRVRGKANAELELRLRVNAAGLRQELEQALPTGG